MIKEDKETDQKITTDSNKRFQKDNKEKQHIHFNSPTKNETIVCEACQINQILQQTQNN